MSISQRPKLAMLVYVNVWMANECAWKLDNEWVCVMILAECIQPWLVDKLNLHCWWNHALRTHLHRPKLHNQWLEFLLSVSQYPHRSPWRWLLQPRRYRKRCHLGHWSFRISMPWSIFVLQRRCKPCVWVPHGQQLQSHMVPLIERPQNSIHHEFITSNLKRKCSSCMLVTSKRSCLNIYLYVTCRDWQVNNMWS